MNSNQIPKSKAPPPVRWQTLSSLSLYPLSLSLSVLSPSSASLSTRHKHKTSYLTKTHPLRAATPDLFSQRSIMSPTKTPQGELETANSKFASLVNLEQQEKLFVGFKRWSSHHRVLQDKTYNHHHQHGGCYKKIHTCPTFTSFSYDGIVLISWWKDATWQRSWHPGHQTMSNVFLAYAIQLKTITRLGMGLGMVLASCW